MSTIRILLADDHVLVREGTRELLEREEDFQVVAEASDGEGAVQLTASRCPDVALVDITTPRLNGIEVTKQIEALYPSTAVLILTAYDDDPYVLAPLEAGAAGYLLKNVRGRDLIEAVRAIHAGESVLHPVIGRKVLDRFACPPGKPPEDISPRQLTERGLEGLRLAANLLLHFPSPGTPSSASSLCCPSPGQPFPLDKPDESGRRCTSVASLASSKV